MPSTTAPALAAYQVPDTRLDDLQSRVSRLAKRCAKLGLEPLALTVVRHDVRVRVALNGERFKKPCSWVELSGFSPLVAGYEFLARVEHTAAGNLVSRVPSCEPEETLDLTAYRTAKNVCDHCHAERNRRDTFVLRAPDGKLVQIGRNCLADYIRTADTELLVSILTFVEELSRSTGGAGDDDWEDGCGGGGWHLVLETPRFLACAVSCVRRNGWAPRSGGNFSESTATQAAWVAGPRPTPSKDNPNIGKNWDAAQPTAEDHARACAILVWLSTNEDQGDYMHNLRVACALPEVTGRTEGILASATVAYARHVEREEASRRTVAKVDAGYFGEIKEKILIKDCKVTLVRCIEGMYGVTTLIGLEAPSGHEFKWFASGEVEIEVGQTITIKGSVKKHEEYKGRKGTVLTRCTINPVEKAPRAKRAPKAA